MTYTIPASSPTSTTRHLIAAARGIHGRPLVVPTIAYGNIMVPGHEIPLHVDVPEFRGADRRAIPQWLLIVMGQSGLFEDWRLPIATAVSWFHDREFGGEFVLLADGPQGSASTIPVRFNSAIVTDTDSVFHGVERLAGPTGSIAPLSELPIRPGMRLYREADGTWRARGGNAPDVSYRWEELRLSISWKAYCFRDESEYQHWAQHQDGLTLETILQSFVHDLRRRDLMGSDVPSDTKFARLLVDTYVRFPSASVQ